MNLFYKKIYFTFYIAFGSFFVLKGGELFLPKEEYDVSHLPPFQSNLLKEERIEQEKEEAKTIEQVVRKVVQSSDKELEKQAEELVKDKEKLSQFLTALSAQRRKDLVKTEDDVILPSSNIQNLLESVYQDPSLLQKNISLKLKDTDIREAIELIGKAAGLYFVVDAGVTGIVNNIWLKDVSVAAALNIILSSNRPRLALVKEFDVWRILRLRDAINILKNKAEDLLLQDFVSDFATISHAKWSESFKLHVEKMWDGIIGPRTEKEGYYIVFDDASRKVFFRGKKGHIQIFKSFLKEVDQIIPQVKIETRVIIASKDFEESLGLQVSGVYNRSASIKHGWDYAGFGPVKTNGQGDIPADKLTSWALNLLPTNASQFLNLPLIFGGRDLNTKRLNLILNAAENKNEINTILKPTLLVNSEEPSEILVGEQVPIETSVQERIEGSLRDVNTINYKELGMKLKVKPIVTPDKSAVFLDIYVENSYVKDGTTSFDAKKAIIVTTKSHNRVMLRSGQTTMIGGLISNDNRNSKQGIPILQDIPLLGALFRGSKKTKSDNQLMIFISPTVV